MRKSEFDHMTELGKKVSIWFVSPDVTHPIQHFQDAVRTPYGFQWINKNKTNSSYRSYHHCCLSLEQAVAVRKEKLAREIATVDRKIRSLEITKSNLQQVDTTSVIEFDE